MRVSPVSLLQTVRRLIDRPALPPAALSDLVKLARTTRVPGGSDNTLSRARNAHRTNTPAELAAALRGPYDFLEGDVFLEHRLRWLPGEAVMDHDPQKADGMTLDEWLAVGAASGRGLKLDIKQAAAIPEVIRRVKAHGIPAQRLILNVQLPGGGLARLFDPLLKLTPDDRDFQALRAAFPGATIALTPQAPYTPEVLAAAVKQARRLGGPVMFPLRAELITPAVVAALAPAGRIAAWNDPKTYAPRDLAAERRRLQGLGVDGMIDLRV